MLVMCLLGIAVIFLPSILAKRLKWNIPKSAMISYLIFLYCAIVLGEVQDFYYKVPSWDVVLHAFSGGMLAVLGFIIIYSLNEQKKIKVHLSPLFVSIFAFCFALTIGTLWEVYEFSVDGLLGLNAQKHTLATGEQLVGRSALKDTMKDLIVDAIAAFVVSTGYYIAARKRQNHSTSSAIKQRQSPNENP
jgi:mannose/fructose/N-acetylgalactosamine-specific phosphotransferase system component IIC